MEVQEAVEGVCTWSCLADRCRRHLQRGHDHASRNNSNNGQNGTIFPYICLYRQCGKQPLLRFEPQTL